MHWKRRWKLSKRIIPNPNPNPNWKVEALQEDYMGENLPEWFNMASLELERSMVLTEA